MLSSLSRQILLCLFSVAVLLVCYFCTVDVATKLSPQGCRMSRMTPSYVLYKKFNTSWTPLAERYSLWLYREVGWEDTKIGGGRPVLFIPGNAGSSRQVRSIASSATRQYYTSPGVVAPEFASQHRVTPLDFFAVEFNEDLSAFHGPTLESEIAYTTSAVEYILSLYPTGTEIVVLGHSMGGIVATALPANRIAAIITMSTPHRLPPARFDARIDVLYEAREIVVPLVSLCGGATDMMIPSEACVLPPAPPGMFYRTVFSSALEGAWTGVGHQVIVWCHQVRWRVARAVLEMATASSPVVALDRWLRDGHELPFALQQQGVPHFSSFHAYEKLSHGHDLVLKHPLVTKTYMLPVPRTPAGFASEARHKARFVMYVSQGTVHGLAPHAPIPLRVSAYTCTATAMEAETGESSEQCELLQPVVLRLLPSPVSGYPFPVPHEGADESEAIVLLEAEVDGATAHSIAVSVENADGRGWIVGGFVDDVQVRHETTMARMALGGQTVALPEPNALKMTVTFPNLLSNVLVVYRVAPILSTKLICKDSVMPALLAHTSQPEETHYFPLTTIPSQRILVHTHAHAPYLIDVDGTADRGVTLTIYSSGSDGCLRGIQIGIDWKTTVGRWATRYYTTLACWCIAIVCLIVFNTWSEHEIYQVPLSTVSQSLQKFSGRPFFALLAVGFISSLLPLPKRYYLGTGGESFFAPLSVLILTVAVGVVNVSWLLLMVLMRPFGRTACYFSSRAQVEVTSVRRSTLISMAFIFILIFFFIPWQVAYLGCWMIHFWTCASMSYEVFSPPSDAPLLPRRSDESGNGRRPETATHSERRKFNRAAAVDKTGNVNHCMHVLLLMTWLVPLAAPVLVVWVRTLATAGLTPFDGDHFFGNVAPFLVFVDFASWTTSPLLPVSLIEQRYQVSVRWGFVVLAAAALVIGPRRAYFVFDVAKVVMGFVVVCRIGPRYWGSTQWTAT
ncbi:GPI-inositol-deacylase [Fistulina hepatica ATCC 64428]|uniref:GPI inositol-deacylase n=1 Tax=Fistulina hepatica ATCC 64428 TaxID=1128425 RepID=A0A0D7AL67_9AGAR|nr:GPI-inositol-deacylase [Fistulina hepatica ATCC 64428]